MAALHLFISAVYSEQNNFDYQLKFRQTETLGIISNKFEL